MATARTEDYFSRKRPLVPEDLPRTRAEQWASLFKNTGVALAVVACLVTALGTAKGVGRIIRAKREIRALDALQVRLVAERDSLVHVDSLMNSRLSRERIERERFGRGLPGEMIYRYVRQKPAPQPGHQGQ